MPFETDRSYGDLSVMCADTSRRLGANARGTCPVDMTRALVDVAHAQSCGKCTPCRIGLGAMTELFEAIIDGSASENAIDQLEQLAEHVRVSSDCAVGYQAAEQVLLSVRAFRDDFEYHAATGRCLRSSSQGVPCVVSCPAHVDIPGYVALTAAGRYDDAVELIRKDNPFPSACAYICEHPCEKTCRRTMVDDAVNIRGIKRYAVDHAKAPRATSKAAVTGKSVAVVGAGPAGLTCAFFLARMGHAVTVFEQREKAGGMLRYGIPNYRLPKDILDDEIASIEAMGVDIRCGVHIDGEAELEKLRADFDAVFVTIGAHGDKKVGIPGEDARGVVPAVEMLRAIGEGRPADYSGKHVCVIGGGNVAMDAARSAMRMGARSVTVVYRRRVADMTALDEEIEGTIADGCEIASLMAPVEILTDASGDVRAVLAQPQIIGPMKYGRPSPVQAEREPVEFPCEVVIVAIGQDIQSESFEAAGLSTTRKRFDVDDETLAMPNADGVFAGGDCMRGPATVILSIADGKKAARAIDTYLGFHHVIDAHVDIPAPRLDDRAPCGRSVMGERSPKERKRDFELVEYGLSDQEIRQETLRCLNCDHFGCGILHENGRTAW